MDIDYIRKVMYTKYEIHHFHHIVIVYLNYDNDYCACDTPVRYYIM